MKNNEYTKNYGEELEYLGITFIPYKQLGKNKNPHLESDFELGFSTYDWWENKKDYSYDEFYKAMNNSEADIFMRKDNGKIYIPCNNELFITR